ncbi:hypothetical protein D3C72_1245330 [compost metagenome]
MQQIAMSRMHLNHFETGFQRTLRRVDKGLDHLVNLRFAHLHRCGVLRVESNLRRPDRHPAALLRLDATLLA